MGYTVAELIDDCVSRPMYTNAERETIEDVWEQVLVMIDAFFQAGQGINLPPMGKIGFRRADNSHMSGKQREKMKLTPIFIFFEPFLQLYKLSSRTSKVMSASTSGAVPIRDLNLTRLASLANSTKDVVQGILKDLWAHLGAAVQSGQAVAIDFGIGTLKSTLNRRVTFAFAGENVTANAGDNNRLNKILAERGLASSRQGQRQPRAAAAAAASSAGVRASTPRSSRGGGPPPMKSPRSSAPLGGGLAVGGRSASRASDVWHNTAQVVHDPRPGSRRQPAERDTHTPSYARLTTSRAAAREAKYTPSHSTPRAGQSQPGAAAAGVATFAFAQPLGEPTSATAAVFGGTRDMAAPNRSRRGAPEVVKETVTKDAFARFQQDVEKTREIERKEDELQRRTLEKLNAADQARDHERRARIRDNQDYLKQQIEDNVRRKISHRLEVFAEDLDDQPIVSVLPGDKGRDLPGEMRAKREFAAQLEEQMTAKRAYDKALRDHEREVAAANDRIAAQNVAKEQEDRFRRKRQEGSDLQQTWRQQLAAKEMEKKVGIAPKVGTKVA